MRDPCLIQRFAEAWKDSSFSAWNAGFIAVIISFAGPMTLILQAAEEGGLGPEMTTSWVWAASVCTGIVTLVMSLTMRLPMVAAWSIPGSVLLIAGLQRYSINELVGVYLIVSVASILLSVTGVFSRIVELVPTGVTNGVLAGILLPICFQAVSAGQDIPVMAMSMFVAYLVTRRMAPLFAVPIAMLAGVIALLAMGALDNEAPTASDSLVAQPVWITPDFDITAMLSIGVPLLFVTMAGQNLPGIDMMRGFGYRFNARTALTACNIGGVVFAPFGLHSANLATVTGIVCAGPEAHPARRVRYVAGVAAGVFYLIAGLFAPVIVTLMTMISAAALAMLSGLVLLPALTTALTTLMRQPRIKTVTQKAPGFEAGIVALVVTASEITIMGISSPVWGLLAGLLVHLILDSQIFRAGKDRQKAAKAIATVTPNSDVIARQQPTPAVHSAASMNGVNTVGRKPQ